MKHLIYITTKYFVLSRFIGILPIQALFRKYYNQINGVLKSDKKVSRVVQLFRYDKRSYTHFRTIAM